MSEEIIIPKDFDKGLKKGDLKLGNISQNVNDNIINELHDEFKKINEEFAEEIKKEPDLIIDKISWNILIDYLLDCRTIYEENNIFNKNISFDDFLKYRKIYEDNDIFNKKMSLGNFFQLVKIFNKCD